MRSRILVLGALLALVAPMRAAGQHPAAVAHQQAMQHHLHQLALQHQRAMAAAAARRGVRDPVDSPHPPGGSPLPAGFPWDPNAHIVIPPQMLQGAKFWNHNQVVRQTLGEPNNGEVRQYLSNPRAWQKKLLAQHAMELGVPTWRVVLADGTIIRAWKRPPTPPGVTRYHYFTGTLAAGYTRQTVFDAGYMYEFDTPKNVQAQISGGS